jgi:hypothetical protein
MPSPCFIRDFFREYQHFLQLCVQLEMQRQTQLASCIFFNYEQSPFSLVHAWAFIWLQTPILFYKLWQTLDYKSYSNEFVVVLTYL